MPRVVVKVLRGTNLLPNASVQVSVGNQAQRTLPVSGPYMLFNNAFQFEVVDPLRELITIALTDGVQIFSSGAIPINVLRKGVEQAANVKLAGGSTDITVFAVDFDPQSIIPPTRSPSSPNYVSPSSPQRVVSPPSPYGVQQPLQQPPYGYPPQPQGYPPQQPIPQQYGYPPQGFPPQGFPPQPVFAPQGAYSPQSPIIIPPQQPPQVIQQPLQQSPQVTQQVVQQPPQQYQQPAPQEQQPQVQQPVVAEPVAVVVEQPAVSPPIIVEQPVEQVVQPSEVQVQLKTPDVQEVVHHTKRLSLNPEDSSTSKLATPTEQRRHSVASPQSTPKSSELPPIVKQEQTCQQGATIRVVPIRCKQLGKEYDVGVKVTVGSKDYTTSTKSNTTDPYWDKESNEFKVQSLNDTFAVEVFHKKVVGKKTLGNYSTVLKELQLRDGYENTRKEFELDTGSVILYLTANKFGYPSDPTLVGRPEKGIIRITAVEVLIMQQQTTGFCKVQVGDQIKTTETLENSDKTIWRKELTFKIFEDLQDKVRIDLFYMRGSKMSVLRSEEKTIRELDQDRTLKWSGERGYSKIAFELDK